MVAGRSVFSTRETRVADRWGARVSRPPGPDPWRVITHGVRRAARRVARRDDLARRASTPSRELPRGESRGFRISKSPGPRVDDRVRVDHPRTRRSAPDRGRLGASSVPGTRLVEVDEASPSRDRRHGASSRPGHRSPSDRARPETTSATRVSIEKSSTCSRFRSSADRGPRCARGSSSSARSARRTTPSPPIDEGQDARVRSSSRLPTRARRLRGR